MKRPGLCERLKLATARAAVRVVVAGVMAEKRVRRWLAR